VQKNILSVIKSMQYTFLGVNSQEINSGAKPRSIQYGKCLSNTAVRFVVGSNTTLLLVGKSKW